MYKLRNIASLREKFRRNQIVAEQVKLESERPIKVIHKDSNFIAFLSLVISILVAGTSIYAQFFYEKYAVTASFFDGMVANDTTLNVNLIFHNRGNQYSSILRNDIIFYQRADSIEEKGLKFDSIGDRVYRDEFDPIVISPGQEVNRSMHQRFNFSRLNLKNESFKLKDTIRIALAVGFTNPEGYHSSNILKIGWLLLDDKKSIQNWELYYNYVRLESNRYWSSSYKTK
jgi:hypothetical protein